MINTFDIENKELANNFLNDYYYNQFRRGKKSIEIFLLGRCKANCQYCYLKQHPELYPHEINDYTIIIQNLEKLIDWYIKNKFYCKIDIFSGEWLTTPLADKVFDLFEEKFSKINPKYRPKEILIPDNGHFLENPDYLNKVENYIERMKKLQIPLYLSLSVDGYYCDYARKEHKDEFYDTLYEFCSKHNYGIHPMISSDNVQYWIENYKWWRDKCPKITRDFMMLEVRDNSWTSESLNQLIQFCNFLIEEKFAECNYDKYELLKYIFDLYERSNQKEQRKYIQNTPIRLTSRGFHNNLDRISCAMQNNLCIRIGDLSIGPCHRLFYPEQVFGKYILNENGEILEFEPKNVSSLIVYKNIKISCLPYCENCLFNNYCLGHCFGASYETYGNPFVPNKEVCDLFKSKITFILYKLYMMDILDEDGLKFIEKHYNPLEFKQFKDLYSSIILNSNLGKCGDEIEKE